jgi:hypothetical protein
MLTCHELSLALVPKELQLPNNIASAGKLLAKSNGQFAQIPSRWLLSGSNQSHCRTSMNDNSKDNAESGACTGLLSELKTLYCAGLRTFKL